MHKLTPEYPIFSAGKQPFAQVKSTQAGKYGLSERQIWLFGIVVGKLC